MANKKFYYVDGVTIAIARKILLFFFQENFDRAFKNDDNYTYDVFLIKPKEIEEQELLKEDIKYFLDFFGNSYKFYYSENR